MKNKILSFVGLFLFGTGLALAQEKTEKFEVKGNCGMCESRIEKAAQNVKGVSAADWNQKTKMLEVKLDASVASVDKVQKAVAAVGHDTPLHKASENVYDKLPGCCKYDRTSTKSGSGEHENHKH